MAFQTLRNEYFKMPPVTRAYMTACVLTTTAVQMDIVSPFQLYFNPTLIIYKYQIWRVISSFLFFGTFGFNFFFNMVFTYKYCRMLEEGSFRGRTADFTIMFVFGAICMIIAAFFVNLLFLGQAFTIMLVYVWSRRNPFIRMNFFGLLNFHAPYLPWVLLGFSILLGNTVMVDVIGMAIGHVYYYAEDVFPHQAHGFRILVAPQILKTWLDPSADDPDYEPVPEARGAEFNWDDD